MKMLLIVFRESIVQHIHAVLKENEVSAYTEIHNVAGMGETGPSVKSFLSPGANCLIMAALPEPAAYRPIEEEIVEAAPRVVAEAPVEAVASGPAHTVKNVLRCICFPLAPKLVLVPRHVHLGALERDALCFQPDALLQRHRETSHPRTRQHRGSRS